MCVPNYLLHGGPGSMTEKGEEEEDEEKIEEEKEEGEENQLGETWS